MEANRRGFDDLSLRLGLDLLHRFAADAHDVLHTVEHLQRLDVALLDGPRANRAQNRIASPGRAVNIEPQFDDLFDHFRDLRFARRLFHHDYHFVTPGLLSASGDHSSAVFNCLSSSHSFSIIVRSRLRDSSMMRSKSLRMAPISSGPSLMPKTWRMTS